MKKLITFLSVCLLSVGTVANAAPLLIVSESPTADGTAYGISIDLDNRNGTFNTLQFEAFADAPNAFINLDDDGFDAGGNPIEAGANSSSYAGILGDPPRFGGLGMSFGSTEVTPHKIGFDGAILGGAIDVSAPLFLGNVVLPSSQGGNVKVRLIDGNGNDLDVLTATFGGAPIPEPTTLALFGLGMVGLVGLRRRQG